MGKGGRVECWSALQKQMLAFIFEYCWMKFNYRRHHRSSHDRSSSSRHRRRSSRSRSCSSDSSRNNSHHAHTHRRYIRSPDHRNGYKRSRDKRSRDRHHSRNRRHSSRERNHSKERKQQYRHRREKEPYRIEYKRHSPSSPSKSSSASSSLSSSISSSTRKRRTTPHFKFKIGEKLGHKYKVTRLLGTGTFGRVLEARCRDSVFAVKIIKPVQKYVDSAKTERNIVKKLNEADPHNRSRIVRFVESFYHHQYYCMVFQPLGPSLYDVIKHNNHVGYPLKLVQAFARQLFEAVGFMHQHSYTHTDLKPQNILLCSSELYEQLASRKDIVLPTDERVKLIDFGGATHSSQRHSSIINTRQYRSPEVILQCCEWKESSDVWSIGCIIAQLYTGNLLFPTHDDLQHLLMIIKNGRKKLPSWMVKKCKNDLAKAFKDGEVDERAARKQIKHWEDIQELACVDQIFKGHPQLCDLIMRCLEMDPGRRISCEQALKHPFFEVRL